MFDFDADTGEIWIHDEIGPSWWGLIDTDMVKSALKQIGSKRAVVRLNTPGGSVDHGIAIFNMLKEHAAGVTTVVDSLAASMGSYLLQAGDRRIVNSNAMVMIHDPWSITMGNSVQMRKDADILDKYAERMIPDYAARSGKSVLDIQAIMREETWYTAQEAVDAGFADEVASGAKAAIVKPVVGDLAKFAKNMPEPLKKAMQSEAKRPLTRKEVADRISQMTVAGMLPPPVSGVRM